MMITTVMVMIMMMMMMMALTTLMMCAFSCVFIYTVQNKLRTNCSQTCQRQSFELSDLKF